MTNMTPSAHQRTRRPGLVEAAAVVLMLGLAVTVLLRAQVGLPQTVSVLAIGVLAFAALTQLGGFIRVVVAMAVFFGGVYLTTDGAGGTPLSLAWVMSCVAGLIIGGSIQTIRHPEVETDAVR